MKTIIINGTHVQVSPETYMRILKIALERSLPFSAAIAFCLQKII